MIVYVNINMYVLYGLKRHPLRKAIDYHAFVLKTSAPVPSVAETVTKKSSFFVTADAVQNTDVTYGAAPLSFEIY